MDKQTLSNYGLLTVVTLILAVMLAFATPFGTYVGDGVVSVANGFVGASDKGLDEDNISGLEKQWSDKLNTGTRNGIIPTGATYTPNGGATLTGDGTNTFPEMPADGDIYEEGDYFYYYYYSSPSGWYVEVADNSKTTYGEIVSEIAGQPITDMNYTFQNCRSLTTAPTIPNSVTSMDGTFKICKSLTTAPVIPNGVTSMSGTFGGCSSLTTAPTIPSSVTNMSGTFSGCKSLTTAPVIPNGVTNMRNTFDGCTSLTTAPTISNSVTNMYCTFQGCTSLTTAPTIPNGVTSMSSTFSGCTSLTTAPAIPSSVTNMSGTFSGCTKLTGTIEVNANPTSYNGCLQSTQITGITGSCSQETKDALMRTK